MRPAMGFYPSSASIRVLEYGEPVVKGSCNRRLFYEAYPEIYGTFMSPKEMDFVWRAEMGNVIHDLIVTIAKEAGIYIADELAFYWEEKRISGRADLIYKDPTIDKPVGAEIKTIGDYPGRKGVVTGYPKSPKIYHTLQAMVYLDYFRRSHFEINRWDIMYIARCTGERNTFHLTFTDKDELCIDGEPTGIHPGMVYSRIEELRQYIREGKLPPRDFEIRYSQKKLVNMAKRGQLAKKMTQDVLKGKKVRKGDSACSNCPFQDICWGKVEAPPEPWEQGITKEV